MMHPWNRPLFDSLGRRAERLPHALLIHGARGTGKLALAEHIAITAASQPTQPLDSSGEQLTRAQEPPSAARVRKTFSGP